MATEKVDEQISVANMRDDLDAVIAQARKTKRPIVVTDNGREAVIIIDAAQYHKESEERELIRGILEGEDAIRAGKVVSMEEVEAHLGAILAEANLEGINGNRNHT
ncbi:MAG: type II toxin-antitoxin system prevent-host-death family antitoxin [Thermomicrobiales bacterium]